MLHHGGANEMSSSGKVNPRENKVHASPHKRENFTFQRLEVINLNKRYPAHRAGFALHEPPRKAFVVKGMSAHRPKPRRLFALELHQTDPASVHGGVYQHELELDAAVFRDTAPFDFDISKKG